VLTRYDELTTERLLMRRWRRSDRAPFAALNADADVMRYFPSTQDRATSDAAVDRIEQAFEDQGFGLWALEVRGTGAFIGFTGLNPMPEGVPGEGGLEVAWRLAKAAWGNGYATEAAQAALEVAFTGLELDEVWSMTAVTNTPSRRVMERLGMTPYAHFDHPRVPHGSPVRPHVAYHLARSVWRDAARHVRAGQ
jgi:RimJ/RimL family protein N-acetyltransferase